MDSFKERLTSLISEYNLGAAVGLPDFVLAGYMVSSIKSLTDMQTELKSHRFSYQEDRPEPNTLNEEVYDESMDGDHESALRSVGWGTDEDYAPECGLDYNDDRL
jgi:hypothetical protein